MPDIFISYSRKDKEKADQLSEILASAGLTVWIDREGIDVATSWSGEIVDAIDQCKVFTVLLSPSSVESRNVIREVALAFEKNKKILPLDLEPVELTRDLQYHLAGIQRAPMTNIDAIIRSLGKLGLASANAPLPPKIVKGSDPRKSLMILPFEDLSPTGDNQWFTDGMASELISVLAKIKSLRVIDWNTSKLFRERKVKTLDLARELEVRYFIEGQVRKFGDQLKISVTLLDIETGDHLWQNSLTGTMLQVFEIQEEVAKRVASGLELHLTQAEETELSERSTKDPEAYELLLRANSYYRKSTQEALKVAIELLSHALEIDPNYAMAMSSKAMSLGVLYRNYEKDPRYLEEAEALLNRALALHPNAVRTRSLLSLIYSLEGREQEAEQVVVSCVAAAPDSAPIHFDAGFFYADHQRPDRAAHYYERAIALDPDHYTTYLNLLNCYKLLEDTKKLKEYAGRLLPLLEKRIRLMPDDIRLQIQHADTLRLANGNDAVTPVIEPLLDRKDLDAICYYDIAALLAVMGDRDRALSILSLSLERGFGNPEHLKHDPDLRSLRDLPEFQVMLSSLDSKRTN